MSKKIMNDFLNTIIADTKNDKIKWYPQGVGFNGDYGDFIFNITEKKFSVAEKIDNVFQEIPKSDLISKLFNLIENDIKNHKYAINTVKKIMNKIKQSENYMDMSSFVKNKEK